MKRIGTIYKDAFSGLSKEIWLLTLITLINRAGTMVVPFIAIYLTKEMDFSYGQSGIIMGFFGLGSVVGTQVGGYLTDKFGYYSTMFWSLLLGGIALFSLIFIEQFEMWCVAVFLVAAIADCFRPANMAAIGFYSKPENRTRSLGLIRLAVNLGFGVGPAIGGIIAGNFGFMWIFIIDGITCIVAAFLLKGILKEVKIKKHAIEVMKESPTLVKAPSPYRDKTFMIFVLAMLFNSIVFLQFNSTLGLYTIEKLHYTEDQFGLLLALNGFIIAFIEMPLIFLLEKKEKLMLYMIAGGILMCGMGFVSLNIALWWGMGVVCILLLTFGEIISFPFSAAFSLSRAVEENRGRYMGLYGIAFSVGHIIAPMLGMFLIEQYGYTVLWYVMGMLTLISVFGILLVQNRVVKNELAIV